MYGRVQTSIGPMEWADRAACRGSEPDLLFVPGAEQHRAKRICEHCPVKLDCLVEALDHRIEYGVWGGLTERQRRVVLASRPDLESWRPVLEAVVRTAGSRQRRAGSAGCH